MRFAIRDDDLNYFYTPDFIDATYSRYYNAIKISMSAIPYVMGNWPALTRKLEIAGPYGIKDNLIQEIRRSNDVFDISKNYDLCEYVREKIQDQKLYLCIHGIHHRNNDRFPPVVDNNFAIGAEFNTNRDLTSDLENGVSCLEDAFSQKITVFTPPQNNINMNGLKAVVANNLDLCAYFPAIRNVLTFVQIFGLINCARYIDHRFKCRTNDLDSPYPEALSLEPRFNKRKYMDHCSLQPGTNVDKLIEKINDVYQKNGDFVLSTHSYAFDYQVSGGGRHLMDEFDRIINYVTGLPKVSFVTLGEIMK